MPALVRHVMLSCVATSRQFVPTINDLPAQGMHGSLTVHPESVPVGNSGRTIKVNLLVTTSKFPRSLQIVPGELGQESGC